MSCRGYIKLDYFQGRDISTRLMGDFCNSLFLSKSLFFSTRGTANPAFVCFTASSCFTQKWLPFPIVLKRNEATHLFSWLGFAVTATDRSLHPVSGASNEQLVASAHWEEEAAILRTSSFVQRGCVLIFPATVEGNFKNKQNISPNCSFLLGGKEGGRSIQ